MSIISRNGRVVHNAISFGLIAALNSSRFFSFWYTVSPAEDMFLNRLMLKNKGKVAKDSDSNLEEVALDSESWRGSALYVFRPRREGGG